MKVHYKQIDNFVEQYDHLSWEGWDVAVDVPNHAAWMRKDGIQKEGRWFRRSLVSPNENGFYEFDGTHNVGHSE